MKTPIKAANKNRVSQTFAYRAPGAMSVMLAGDFTDWRHQAVSMRKDSEGIWRVALPLEPGPHHYRFVVDGEWRDDPECAIRVPNPYGGENSVVVVP